VWVERAILSPMSSVENQREATQVTPFGKMPDGTEVELYTVWDGRIGSAFSSEATFCNFGARLVSMKVPDRTGRVADVVLGYDSLALYLADKAYLGAIVGRYGNRIASGRFSLDGKEFQVPQNDATNALHGGPVGFDQAVWQAKVIADGVEFTLVSPDGDQGFPGTLTLTVRYTFHTGVLKIDYTATTDAPTIVNVTNHAYFNLAGEGSGTILKHEISIPAEHFTPINAALIPTGELTPVEGTPFDLRKATPIGRHIEDDHEQLKLAGGYDHNFVLGNPGEMKFAARVSERTTGRVLTVETTEPGVQFYTGNFLDGSMPNRRNGRYVKRSGFCLETQHYPDSPNQPGFPTTTLQPAETLRSTTIYSFTTEA
jgi:aldose 1-epimerase